MFGQRARKVSSHARAKELDQPERERASWRAREITREMARARTMLDSSPDCFCLISYRVRGSFMFPHFLSKRPPDPQTRHAPVPADPQTLLTPRATEPQTPQTHRPIDPSDPQTPQTHRPTDPQTHRPPDHRGGTAECAERLNPPPPAWQGSRACEIGVRFH